MQTDTAQSDRQILGLVFWLFCWPIFQAAKLVGRRYENPTEEED